MEVRLSGCECASGALLPAIRAAFLPGLRREKPGVKLPGKKIEQEASQSCLKSEYLTLLNSFRVLQHCDYKALGPAVGPFSPCLPPKLFNEKELYGR
jgi:hypothetical protein